MWKIAFFLVFALGATLTIPALRQKAAPYFAPVTSKLAPITDKFVQPTKRWSAKNEAGALLHKLSEDDAQKKELPSALSFPVWVRTHSKNERRGNDPWGRPYYLINDPHQITVGSSGPDRRRNTPDDIRVSAPVQ